MLRAKEGEVLHCQLEALANNRDTTEEVRIKKTVDAWIKALSKDIQTKAAGQDLVTQCRPSQRDAAAPTAAQKKTTGTRDERGKDMLRTAGTKSSGRVARGQSGKTEEKTKRTQPSAKLRPAQHMQARVVVEEEERPGDDGDAGAGEDYLVKLYGKALYEGHRRTLKKGPYLRFSSPSPRSRGPRPRVVESVRGVKMKSSKTQTNLAPDRTVSFPLPPSTNQPQYIFSPTRGGRNDPMEGYLLPIAIPLGRRRVDGTAPQPSRVVISDRPIVVTTSLPPSPPRPAPAPRKPTVTLLEVKSDRRRRPPKLTVQVQPSVNIEPPASTLVRPPPPGPPTPPPQVQTVEETLERRKREEEEEEEKDEDVFPGTNFLAVVDISQETEEDSEVLDGENRTAQSEERSDASDVVEEDTNAPVGSEMIRQYINEALTEIVAQMLDQRDGQTQERAAPHSPTQEPPPPQQEDLVPTPMPTPEASISPIVASPGRSPLGTPEPSDQGSPELTPRDVQPAQPQQSTPTEPEPEPVVTPASTPTPTPPTLTPQPSLEPPSQRNHPWGDAELPLAEEQPHNSLEMNPQPSKPLVMSVAVEEPFLASPPISIPSIPPPQPACSPTPPPAPLPGPATPSSAPSSSTEDSSSSSSSTVSRTDTAVKHISEGELLFSYNKLLAAQAYEEGLYLPCDIPSFSSSLHEVQDMDYDPPSEGQVTRPQVPPRHDPLLSLLAKMDQGVVSTHAGAMTRPGGSWGLEAEAEEEGSVGEVSEGQRPRLTLAGERVMTGHSLLGPRTRTTGSRIHHPLRTTDPSSGAEARTTGSTETRQRRGSSPGQLSQSADLTELSLGDTCQGPVTIADLGVEPVMPTRSSNFHTGSSHSPPPQIQDSAPLGAQAVDWFSVSTDRPAPILIRTQETHSGAEAQGGSRVMAVRLPSAGLEEQEEQEEQEEEEQEEEEEEASISLGAPGGADSNSSGNDVF
ncbi:protein TALPID3-like [Hypomesus transpacificus]|uniref:protein TALPID3-like n=1 Tax=Hypomesus transpacificus TaxID=137520 RepID=UPI001F076CE0|nr:protein TALPID3-like [Hypomesus transpacificus]